MGAACGLYRQNRTLRRRLADLRKTARSQRKKIDAMETVQRAESESREATESQLRGYLHLMDTLINTIPNPIFFKDNRGTFKGCNRAFAREILGLSQDQVIGCTVRELDGKVSPRLLDLLHLREMGNTPRRFEAGLRCADHRRREFLFIIAPVADATGSRLGRIGVMIDLTEKNRSAREHLQNEKFKGVLETAGAVCHEFNQPLQVLSGYAELALTEGSPFAVPPELARRILSQTERMADITRKLQKITRYETIPYGEYSRIIDIHRSATPAVRESV